MNYFETWAELRPLVSTPSCYPEVDGFEIVHEDRTDFKLTTKDVNRHYLIVAGCSLLLGGFVIGWRAGRLLTVSADAETQQVYLNEKGTASNAVRAEVLNSLRDFQNGYSKRDPRQLDAFMQRLFPEDQDTRVIATDAGEWKTGFDSIARFIRADWLEWGDVRLAVHDSVVNSSGDVAWVATTGKLVSVHSSRSIRGILFVSRPLGWLAVSWVAMVISFPALYEGVHWPTDVIAGAVLGVSFAHVAKIPQMREAIQRHTTRWLRQQRGLFFTALFLWSYEIVNLFDDGRRLLQGLWRLI